MCELTARNVEALMGPQVILVDGVDEAADGDSNVVMDAMVSHLGTLPSWVRIVLTGTIESFSDDAVAEAGFKLVEPTPEQNLEVRS